MSVAKWSDDRFLDGLRQMGDSLADRAVEELEARHDLEQVNRLFKTMLANAEPIAPDAPGPLRDFLMKTATFPADLDRPRVERGGQVFLAHALPATVMLLIPGWLRLLGFGAAPRMLMAELLGPKGMAQAGVEPVSGHRLVRSVVHAVLRLTQRDLDRGPTFLAAGLGKLMFRDLVRVSWDGEVTWLVPDSVAAANKLA